MRARTHVRARAQHTRANANAASATEPAHGRKRAHTPSTYMRTAGVRALVEYKRTWVLGWIETHRGSFDTASEPRAVALMRLASRGQRLPRRAEAFDAAVADSCTQAEACPSHRREASSA